MTEENQQGNNSPESNQPVESSNPVKKEEATLTLKKSTLWKVGTFLFAGLFLISLINGGFNFGPTGAVVAPTDPGAVPSPSGNVKVSITDADPVLGDKNAEITIVEFSDFQCPFCARAADGAIADFKNSDYFKNGEVNLVYKHFPLNSIHPQAQKAAEASECANQQGKFWEYHDLLFANQQSLDDASLKAYASDLGLDTNAFNSCLDNDAAAAKVRKDLGEATAAGGRGTPYFVIVNSDGETQTVSGAVPFSSFESAINALK
jgi:protein-disulfide isomerase